MTDNVVASDQWSQIIFYDEWNTLELKWLPSTRDATEAQARDTMALFAAEAEKRKPSALIVDTTEFLHRWADDMMAWRDKEIIPHYNAGGVTKFAFIAAPGFPGPTVEQGARPALSRPAGFPPGKGPTRGSPGRSDGHDRAAGLTGALDRGQIDDTGIAWLGGPAIALAGATTLAADLAVGAPAVAEQRPRRCPSYHAACAQRDTGRHPT